MPMIFPECAPRGSTDPGSIGRARSAADGNPEPNPVSLDGRARSRQLPPVV